MLRDRRLQEADRLLEQGQRVEPEILEEFGGAERLRQSARYQRQFQEAHERRMAQGQGGYTESYLLARRTIASWLEWEESQE